MIQCNFYNLLNKHFLISKFLIFSQSFGSVVFSIAPADAVDNIISSGIMSTTTHDFLYNAFAKVTSFTRSAGSVISHSLKKDILFN